MGKVNYDRSDESEVFKHKSFSSQKNRRKMGHVMTWVLSVLAVLIAAACIFTFFVGVI